MTDHPASGLFSFLYSDNVRRTFWLYMRNPCRIKEEYPTNRASTEEERESIRAAYANGKTNKELMKEFSRSSFFVSKVTADIRRPISPSRKR